MQEITKNFFEQKCTKVSLYSHKASFGENMPFYEYIVAINGRDFKKYYIVDLTDEKTAKVFHDKIEELRKDFFYNYFSDMWFSGNQDTKFNVSLIFMTDENLNGYDQVIENNFEHNRKRFIKESDLLKLLQRQEGLAFDETQRSFNYNEEEYKLSSLSLLYGENGSGKTRMLNEMSEQFGAPILNSGIDDFYCYGEEPIRRLLSSVDYLNLKETFKKLWSYSLTKNIDIKNIMRFSDKEIKLLMYAAKLSAFEDQQNNGIILLDDIGWHGYDSQRRLNFIEYLSDLSLMGNSVVFASTDHKMKTLVVGKGYKPKIIDLSEGKRS